MNYQLKACRCRVAKSARPWVQLRAETWERRALRFPSPAFPGQGEGMLTPSVRYMLFSTLPALPPQISAYARTSLHTRTREMKRTECCVRAGLHFTRQHIADEE